MNSSPICYGLVIPLEIEISSFHTAAYNEMENEKVLRGELDLIDE